MSMNVKWRVHFQEHKALFVVIAVALFLFELEIFAMAAMKSGRETHLQISDTQGNILFDVKGNHLDDQDKIKFEKTFGHLADHQVNLVTEDKPFPFRAWFAAAVGLPVGAVLLFGFFVKAYEALFIKKEVADHKTTAGEEPSGRMARVLTRISRFNVFMLGALVLLFAIGLWALPYMLVEFGRHSVDIISRYKWVALAAVSVFLGLVIWIIYLRYRLAGKAIESQAEVEKYRLQLQLLGHQNITPQLSDPSPFQLEAPRRLH